MSVECFEDEEESLAASLRMCCSPWGTELESKLFESASILLELGELYLNKVPSAVGIQQKLTFIKCATLISGARSRFEKLLANKEGGDRSKLLFKQMVQILLTTCKARAPNADLLAISDKLLRDIGRIRKDEKIFIEKELKLLADEELLEPELRKKQRQKINKMKDILTENSFFYKNMMKSVSKECAELLGAQPCAFALVGLGSLARDEVTLYSDFEHVILLSDGIDQEDDEKIKEYFRWYSVIFQVIIIGLGETYIPTVGIKSLNDLYSTDSSKNWFFDMHTPGGVSFDGRFPHSCKVPLGKQEPSKDRSHVVELIQPVSRMLKYLSDQEDLKNGYHLRDVLVRSCLVDGDKEVYKQFEDGVADFITRGARDDEVAEQAKFVVENVGEYIDFSQDKKSWNMRKMNFNRIKDFLYRPITLLVGCLSRVSRIFTGSSFDYFAWFRQTHPTIDLHEIEFALAVACEVRLKLYATVGHQRQKAWPRDICRLAGKQHVARTYQTISFVAVMFQQAGENSFGYEKFLKLLSAATQAFLAIKTDTRVLDMLGLHDDAIAENQRRGHEAALSYFSAGLGDVHKRDEYFRKAELLLAQSEEGLNFERIKILAPIRFHQGRYQEGFDLADNWTKQFRNDNPDALSDARYMQLQHMKSICLLKGMPPKKIMERASVEIAESSDSISQIFFRICLSDAQNRLLDEDISQQTLRTAAEECRKHSTIAELPPSIHLEAAKQVFERQAMQGLNEDATLTLELVEMLRSTQQRNTTENVSLGVFDNPIVRNEATKDAELMQIWAKLDQRRQYPLDHDSHYGKLLALLLLNRDFRNFFEISKYFTEAPFESLHDLAVYTALYCKLWVYMKVINDEALVLSENLKAVMNTFDKHLENPFFVGIFRLLSRQIEKKIAFIDCGNKSFLRDLTSVQWNEKTMVTLTKFPHLEIKRKIQSLWGIFHHKATSSSLKSFLCKYFIQMICLSTFMNLAKLFQQHRSYFLAQHFFQCKHEVSTKYNSAVKNYVNFRFRFSATSFWRIALTSKPGSTIRQRSLEMLLFVILSNWESDGFLLTSTADRYVHNAPYRIPCANFRVDTLDLD